LAAKTPQILLVFGLQHFVMLPTGGVRRKMNTVAHLQTCS